MHVSRTNSRELVYYEKKPEQPRREKQAEIQALLYSMPSFKRKRECDSSGNLDKELKPKKARLENQSNPTVKRMQMTAERSAAFEPTRESLKRKNVEGTSNRLQNRSESKKVRLENSHQSRQSSQPQFQSVVQKKQRPALSSAPRQRKTETKVQKLRKQYLKNHIPRFSNQATAPKRAIAPKEDIAKKKIRSEQLGSRLSRPLPITPREAASPKTVSKTAYQAKKHFWTPSEDRKLLDGYQKYGNQWALINEEYGLKLSSNRLHIRYWRHVHPQLKKGAWSQEERDLLTAGIEKYGLCSWKKISKKIFKYTRSDLGCHTEYDEVLDPSIRKNDPWTKKEDEKIRSMRSKNFRWSRITMEMPGRSIYQIMQRYKTILKAQQIHNFARQIEAELERK